MTDKEQIAMLREALKKIFDGIPSVNSEGQFLTEHFDMEGNYAGTEFHDPLAIIQSIVGVAHAALAATAPSTQSVCAENAPTDLIMHPYASSDAWIKTGYSAMLNAAPDSGEGQ